MSKLEPRLSVKMGELLDCMIIKKIARYQKDQYLGYTVS